MHILAPNRYVKNQVQVAYLPRIMELLEQFGDPANPLDAQLDIGAVVDDRPDERLPLRADGSGGLAAQATGHQLNAEFTFASFREGKSNDMGRWQER